MTKECCQQTCPTPHCSKAGRPKGASIITDILSLAARPEVISFAGGLPSPKRFPIEAVKARPARFSMKRAPSPCSTPPLRA